MSQLYTIAPDASGWSLTRSPGLAPVLRGSSRDEAVDRMFHAVERLAPCLVEVRDGGGRLLEQFDFLDHAEPGVEAW